MSGVTTAHTRSLLEESIRSLLSQNASRTDPLESFVSGEGEGARATSINQLPHNNPLNNPFLRFGPAAAGAHAGGARTIRPCTKEAADPQNRPTPTGEPQDTRGGRTGSAAQSAAEPSTNYAPQIKRHAPLTHACTKKPEPKDLWLDSSLPCKQNIRPDAGSGPTHIVGARVRSLFKLVRLSGALSGPAYAMHACIYMQRLDTHALASAHRHTRAL